MSTDSHQFITQKKVKRQALLLELYHESDGNTRNFVYIDSLYESLKNQNADLQWTKQDVADICLSFKENKIIQGSGDMGVPDFWIPNFSYVRLESRGVQLVESMADEQKSAINFTVDNSISVGDNFQGNLAGKDQDVSHSIQNFSTVNDPTVDEAVCKIQELLQQLVTTSPKTTIEKMQLAIQAVEKIEANPNWKQKAIRAAKSGALEVLKSNPVGAFVAGAIEDWTEE
ncbi:MAG: hypothetical protein AAGG51_04150 [Cyanobacteria bacterium P01_G01_bin.54]